MNSLHLSGFGVKVRVRNLKSRSELQITNGRQDDRQYETESFKPRRFPYSSVVVDARSGYISLQAFHWLSKNKIPVFIMNFDGSLISSILPPTSIKATLRASQFKAAANSKIKFQIATVLVHAKIARSLQLLEWLEQRYDVAKEVRLAKREASRLSDAGDVSRLRTVEGRVALRYWETIKSTLPEALDFQGRMTTSHQNDASDPFNAALNYGYGLLEGECRAAINSVGLEASVGFLHDFSNYQTKQSLAYDLQEPFRWLVDMAVIQAFESKTLELHDFYFTGDDYRYRFEVEAKRRFIGLLRNHFNAGVRYRDQRLKWDTVIEQKTSELGRFLTGKSSTIDFLQPTPKLEREDDKEMRTKILSLTTSQAKQLGIGKSTLHYLRLNAGANRTFRVYHKVIARLD